jgi:hypothetical protein
MVALAPDKLCADIVEGLRGIGYRGGLLAEKYRFLDWFSPNVEEREIRAAAFAQTPISYDSACIGIIESGSLSGPSLIDSFRALCAPTILEIDSTEIREWAVSRNSGQHSVIERYPTNQVPQLIAKRAADWKPEAFLRAKNIGDFRWAQQLELFAGLLPELETQIQPKMDPLLRDALSATKNTYRGIVGHAPDPAQLFKLVFWLLTAKVFS